MAPSPLKVVDFQTAFTKLCQYPVAKIELQLERQSILFYF